MSTVTSLVTCAAVVDSARAQRLLCTVAIGSSLSESEWQQMKDLLPQHSDVFALDESEVETVIWPKVSHTVETCDAKPIHQQP